MTLVTRILVPLLLRIVYAKSLIEDAAITASMDSGPWSEIAASVLAARNFSSTLDAMELEDEGAGISVGYFLRNSSIDTTGVAKISSGLSFTHFRLAPLLFPASMHYHFDGLAGVVKFQANGTHVSWQVEPFHSRAYDEWDRCLFLGTGTAKATNGREICFQNPGVNLLPIQGQLWLTIDTVAWGRLDPETLATVPHAHVAVKSPTLNAHPACDGNECFVQHPCDYTPLTGSVCVSRLEPSTTLSSSGSDVGLPFMDTTLYSSTSLGGEKKRLIQHSHSPCITPNFVVAKIDSFAPRAPSPARSGILKALYQEESSALLVMDRRTNESRILNIEFAGGDKNGTSKEAAFVNNHFWNCYETKAATGKGPGDAASSESESASTIVVEVVPATEHYLDSYFSSTLAASSLDWMSIFHPPLRCKVHLEAGAFDASEAGDSSNDTSGSPSSSSSVECEELGQGALFHDRPFDYPTFNPRFKMNPDYRYFYAIAPATASSRWFDSLIKVDVSGSTDSIAAEWAEPGIFLTEASFLPLGEDEEGGEDHGALLSVLYNATKDASFLGIFNASNLDLMDSIPLGGVLPFHAHGIVCPGGGTRCFSNP